MRNFTLATNIVLVILVAILYYLHFSGKKSPVNEIKHNTALVRDKSEVAYIDMDSLQENYTYYKQLKKDFERRQTAANDEITSMQRKFQSRTSQLQQKAATMNQQQQEEAMQEINKLQQGLQGRKQAIDNELYNFNSKMKEDVYSRIQNFLKAYNSSGRYSYIFSYEPGFMFYKDSTLNITPDVISGLNNSDTSSKK